MGPLNLEIGHVINLCPGDPSPISNWVITGYDIKADVYNVRNQKTRLTDSYGAVRLADLLAHNKVAIIRKDNITSIKLNDNVIYRKLMWIVHRYDDVNRQIHLRRNYTHNGNSMTDQVAIFEKDLEYLLRTNELIISSTYVKESQSIEPIFKNRKSKWVL